jgi:gamma-glutamyltranspeptidase / glutathione hydrolase
VSLRREARPLPFILLIAALLPQPLPAAEVHGAHHAAVASASAEASAAGMEVLQSGGNAFDAAVAVAAALVVTEPSGSGLTGGGFFLLHRASDGTDRMIDARETAPSQARREMFLDAAGEPIPGLSTDSALAAGIPGEPAGLALLAAKYGRLSVAQDLAPALRLARDGFALPARLRGGIDGRHAQFAADPQIARNFLDGGNVPAVGTIIRQPELAQTLQRLARDGFGAFYHGELAGQLVAAVRAQGGIWTEQDLAQYHAIERDPIVGHYRGARIVSASLPSSGGTCLIEALNILAQFDLRHVDSAHRKHLIIEALRRAYRDRALYLGDPDVQAVPVKLLTDPAYAAGLAASIRTDRATPSEALPGIGAGAMQGPQTTHFSVLDRDGNRVAATLTLNFGFGSGRMLAGTGLFLNDEMDDFSIKPGVPNGYGLVGEEANAIAPGKRMLSSSTPLFVESGRRLLIAGSPGGSLIISMGLLATLDFLDGADATQIVGAPRFHHQYLPDVVRYEPGALSDAELKWLGDIGHTLQVSSRRWGNMQVIVADQGSGAVQAAADPRGDGAALVQ